MALFEGAPRLTRRIEEIARNGGIREGKALWAASSAAGGGSAGVIAALASHPLSTIGQVQRMPLMQQTIWQVASNLSYRQLMAGAVPRGIRAGLLVAWMPFVLD